MRLAASLGGGVRERVATQHRAFFGLLPEGIRGMPPGGSSAPRISRVSELAKTVTMTRAMGPCPNNP
jgi:hypothetical protein